MASGPTPLMEPVHQDLSPDELDDLLVSLVEPAVSSSSPSSIPSPSGCVSPIASSESRKQGRRRSPAEEAEDHLEKDDVDLA